MGPVDGSQGFGALPPPPRQQTTALEDRRYREQLAAKRQQLIVAGVANAVGGIILRSHALAEGLAVLIAIGVGIFVIVAAVRIANQLYGVGAAILAGVLVLIPIVYIVVVVYLAVQAGKRLRTPPPAPTAWNGGSFS